MGAHTLGQGSSGVKREFRRGGVCCLAGDGRGAFGALWLHPELFGHSQIM